MLFTLSSIISQLISNIKSKDTKLFLLNTSLLCCTFVRLVWRPLKPITALNDSEYGNI